MIVSDSASQGYTWLFALADETAIISGYSNNILLRTYLSALLTQRFKDSPGLVLLCCCIHIYRNIANVHRNIEVIFWMNSTQLWTMANRMNSHQHKSYEWAKLNFWEILWIFLENAGNSFMTVSYVTDATLQFLLHLFKPLI